MVDLHDKPGAMGEITRDLAEASVGIDVAYTIFAGVRLVIVTDDVEKARAALGQPPSFTLPRALMVVAMSAPVSFM